MFYPTRIPLNGLLHSICHKKNRSQMKENKLQEKYPCSWQGNPENYITDCELVESALYEEHTVWIFLKVFIWLESVHKACKNTKLAIK